MLSLSLLFHISDGVIMTASGRGLLEKLVNIHTIFGMYNKLICQALFRQQME